MLWRDKSKKPRFVIDRFFLFTLQHAFAGGIAHVTIEGDPSGGSFALDDLTFTQIGTPIPEPSTLLLFSSGFAIIFGWSSMRRFIIGKFL